MNKRKTLRLLRPDLRTKEGVSTFLYRLTLLFFIVIFCGLLVVTPIDTIFQSQTSGQFWDAIIIVVAYALAVVFIIALCFLRIFYVRKSLSAIPRDYTIRENDIPDRVAKHIHSELMRCRKVLEDTTPGNRGEHIDHPGLRNPTVLEGALDVPYAEVVKTSSAIIQLKARALHPSFGQPYGMAIREYVLLLQSYRLIDSSFDVERFISIYEKARYSGKLLDEKEFNHYMECCFELLYSIKPPGPGKLGHQSYQASPVPPSASSQRLRPVLLPTTSISSYTSGISPFDVPHRRRSRSDVHSPRSSLSYDQNDDNSIVNDIDTNHALSALASLVPVETLQKLYTNPPSRLHSQEPSTSQPHRPAYNRDNSFRLAPSISRQSQNSSDAGISTSSSEDSAHPQSLRSYPSNASVIVRTFSGH